MKLLILVCLILLSSPCFAVTGNDLVDKAHSYDGRIVAYQGEVIGDIMLRGEYAWYLATHRSGRVWNANVRDG